MKKHIETNFLQRFYKSKFIAFTLGAISLYIFYINWQAVLFLFEMKNRVNVAEEKYAKTQIARDSQINKQIDNKTEDAKYRYEKDLFNKVDEGETLVILHIKADDKSKDQEEVLQFNFLDRQIQKINLWWKNL